MRIIKRMAVGLLVVTLSASMIGCSSGKKSESDSQKKVISEGSTENKSDNPLRPETLDTIKVILFGEESPRMAELMENEFQQIFIDEINTKVELMYLPWSENGTGGKVDLMIASGQEFDASIVDPRWAASSVSKGYLKDLSDVIETHLPDWHQNMDEVALDAYRYGDAIYGIPIGNKPTAGVYSTVTVREDIMEEIGMDDLASIEDLKKYVKAANEKHGLHATYDLGSTEYIIRAFGDRNMTPLTSEIWVDQDTKELVNFVETEEFEKAVRLYNEWYTEGLIPKDMLTNTVTNPFESGLSSFFRGTCGTTVIENEPNLKQVIPGAHTKEYYLNSDKPIYKKTYESTAFQVPVTSKKADRVAMFIDLLQKNTELADAFIYGIEGVDYNIVDNKIVAENKSELFYQWMIFNINISTFDESFPEDFIETYRNWDNEGIPSVSFGFSMDFDPVRTEKAQIESIWDELANPMLAGIKDYDTGIEQLRKELDSAGWDIYFEEMQRQWSEFLAK